MSTQSEIPREDRRLTLIVIPHGDLETRTFEISYRKLKVGLILAAALVVVVGVALAFWFPIALQAGRVPGLETQVAQLEQERAKVAELEQLLDEVEAQYERVRELLGADGETGDSPLLPPLRTDSGASPGGEQATSAGTLAAWPIEGDQFLTQVRTEGADAHPGLDIAAPRNAAIHAAGAGVVSETGTDDIYGNYVVIEHPGGLESIYAHASSVLVAPGDTVALGHVIARTGSTGHSSGYHLHFEVRMDGRALDPLAFLPKR